MRKITWFLAAASLSAFLLAAPSNASAQKPVNLSVFNPIQIVPESESVSGLRLSLFHARNADVVGFDWVWLGFHQTTGNFTGVAFVGLAVNMVDGTMTGWQATLGNFANGGMTGAQTGVLNWNGGQSTGMQWGVVNIADEFTGLQLGLVNYTRRMKGVQIGLANIITEGPLPFMVIANAMF
ncbi:MAG: hypothetical protein JRH11_26340 [Deltaproteobacteria bacterium]|nr:hypothetical protein [Deltaproteobacteria bacterium]